MPNFSPDLNEQMTALLGDLTNLVSMLSPELRKAVLDDKTRLSRARRAMYDLGTDTPEKIWRLVEELKQIIPVSDLLTCFVGVWLDRGTDFVSTCARAQRIGAFGPTAERMAALQERVTEQLGRLEGTIDHFPLEPSWQAELADRKAEHSGGELCTDAFERAVRDARLKTKLDALSERLGEHIKSKFGNDSCLIGWYRASVERKETFCDEVVQWLDRDAPSDLRLRTDDPLRARFITLRGDMRNLDALSGIRAPINSSHQHVLPDLKRLAHQFGKLYANLLARAKDVDDERRAHAKTEHSMGTSHEIGSGFSRMLHRKAEMYDF